MAARSDIPTECLNTVGLCRRIEELMVEHFGAVDGTCPDCATILALLLRERGTDAQVVIGSYHLEDEDGAMFGEPHAWVVTPDHILDPARAQFGAGLPLVVTHAQARGIYDPGDHWNYGEEPPSTPERASALRYLARHFARTYWADVGIRCEAADAMDCGCGLSVIGYEPADAFGMVAVCRELGLGELVDLLPPAARTLACQKAAG